MKIAMLLAAAAAFATAEDLVETKDAPAPRPYDKEWHDNKLAEEALEVKNPEVLSEICSGEGLARDCHMNLKSGDHVLGIHTKRVKDTHHVTGETLHYHNVVIEANGHQMWNRHEYHGAKAGHGWGKAFKTTPTTMTKGALEILSQEARENLHQFPAGERAHLEHILNKPFFHMEVKESEAEATAWCSGSWDHYRKVYEVWRMQTTISLFLAQHSGTRVMNVCQKSNDNNDDDDVELADDLPWTGNDLDLQSDVALADDVAAVQVGVGARRRRRQGGGGLPVCSSSHDHHAEVYASYENCNGGTCPNQGNMDRMCSGAGYCLTSENDVGDTVVVNADSADKTVWSNGSCGGSWFSDGEVCNDWTDRQIDIVGGNRACVGGGKEGTKYAYAPRCYVGDVGEYGAHRRRCCIRRRSEGTGAHRRRRYDREFDSSSLVVGFGSDTQRRRAWRRRTGNVGEYKQDGEYKTGDGCRRRSCGTNRRRDSDRRRNWGGVFRRRYDTASHRRRHDNWDKVNGGTTPTCGSVVCLTNDGTGSSDFDWPHIVNDVEKKDHEEMLKDDLEAANVSEEDEDHQGELP